jgi:SAM-dependent methyltransferase
MKFAIERFNPNKFIPPWIHHSHLARYKFVSDYVAGKVVLDCACGDATGSEIFINSGAKVVYALDISEISIQQARQKRNNSGITFLAGDATSLPFPDKSIDVYISLETIEHIDRDLNYLGEVSRLIKSDGMFICSTPNRTITNPGKTLKNLPWNPYHVREYNQKELFRLLSNHWDDVQFFGQCPKPNSLVRLMGFLGFNFSGYISVHIYQLLKLPRLLFDNPSNYRLIKFNQEDDFEFEDILSICTKPKSR